MTPMIHSGQPVPRRRRLLLGLNLIPFVRRAFLQRAWQRWDQRAHRPGLVRWWWPGWAVMWLGEVVWESWRLSRRGPGKLHRRRAGVWEDCRQAVWDEYRAAWRWWDRWLLGWWRGARVRVWTPWVGITLALHADDQYRDGMFSYYPRWWSGVEVAWSAPPGWRFGEGEQVFRRSRRWEWRRWETRERSVAEGVGLEIVRVGQDGEPMPEQGTARLLGKDSTTN